MLPAWRINDHVAPVRQSAVRILCADEVGCGVRLGRWSLGGVGGFEGASAPQRALGCVRRSWAFRPDAQGGVGSVQLGKSCAFEHSSDHLCGCRIED